MPATATSTGNTKKEKAREGSKSEKGHVDTRITPFQAGDTRRCSSSTRRTRTWRPWATVEPLVRWLERNGISINRALNEALLFWAGGLNDEQLRLKVAKARLLAEERDLYQTHRVILRSGAFLDSYAAKLIEGDETLSAKMGRQPLEAVANPKEANVVKRLLARREAVVAEIVEVQNLLLPKEEYVLKGERKPRVAKRRRVKSSGNKTNRAVNNCGASQ